MTYPTKKSFLLWQFWHNTVTMVDFSISQNWAGLVEKYHKSPVVIITFSFLFTMSNVKAAIIFWGRSEQYFEILPQLLVLTQTQSVLFFIFVLKQFWLNVCHRMWQLDWKATEMTQCFHANMWLRVTLDGYIIVKYACILT